MNARTNAEKEWLRKMTGDGACQKEGGKTLNRPTAAKEEPKRTKKDCHHGFEDVAGMDELKQMVMEGFINVLNNQECAKAYGITPNPNKMATVAGRILAERLALDDPEEDWLLNGG